MTTAIERQDQQIRALLDHPQRLGILPTPWFWNDRDNWNVVSKPFAVLAMLILVVVFVLDLPWWAAGPIAGGSILLAQGLLERYIRRQARLRFRSNPAPRALPERTEAERSTIRPGEPPG